MVDGSAPLDDRRGYLRRRSRHALAHGSIRVANVLTFSRIALAPVFAFFVIGGTDDGASGGWLLVAAIVFGLASLTDLFDGWVARRRNEVSQLGVFLDPLADKILVGVALVMLVLYREFVLWAALIIGGREVIVTLLRSVRLRRGQSMSASLESKVKTAIQIPMVLAWLAPREGLFERAQDSLMLVAVALTIISGWMYFTRNEH